MKNRAQTTLEYMILIAIIAAALVATQVYMKRSLQGRLKSGADEFSGGGLYSPGGATSFITATTNQVEDTNTFNKITDTNAIVNQQVERQEELLPFSAEPQR